MISGIADHHLGSNATSTRLFLSPRSIGGSILPHVPSCCLTFSSSIVRTYFRLKLSHLSVKNIPRITVLIPKPALYTMYIRPRLLQYIYQFESAFVLTAKTCSVAPNPRIQTPRDLIWIPSNENLGGICGEEVGFSSFEMRLRANI